MIASARLSRRQLLAWGGVAAGSAYLVLVGGGYGGIYLAQIRLLSVILAVTTIGLWGIVAWRDPAWRPRTVLWPAFLASFVAILLSAGTSTAPRLSADIVGYVVLLGALYLLLQRFSASDAYRDRIAALTVLFTVSIGLLYMAANLQHWQVWWSLLGRIAVPPLRPAYEALWFGNPSAVLTICVVCVASALALLGWATRVRLVVCLALVGLTALVVVVSGSRAGWLGIGIGIGATAIAWLASGARRVALRGAIERLPRLVVAAGAVVILIAAVTFGPGMAGRVLNGGGEDLRASFYVASIRMLEDRPLTGQGPGTWAERRATFTQAGEIDFYIPHAHDIYLETGAELGLVGLAAGVVVVVALGRLLIGAIGGSDPDRRRWGWASLFILVYLGAHQLFDFYPNMPAVLFVLAIPIARLDATAPRGMPRPVGSQQGVRAARLMNLGAGRSVVALGMGIVLVATAWLAAGARPALDNEVAVRALNEGDVATADRLAQSATGADPAMPAYQFTLGLTAARAGDLARAQAAFRAVATADGFTFAWLNLAALDVRAGERAEAMTALANAMRLGRQDTQVALASGAMYETLGETALADDAYAASLLWTPTLAGDPWWSATPDRAARFPGIVDTAIKLAVAGNDWQIAFFAGQPARAIELDSAEEPGAAIPMKIFVNAWNGDAAAFQVIRTGALARPLDFGLLDLAALLADHYGRPADAAAYRGIADIDVSGPGGTLYGITLESKPNVGAGAVDSGAYGMYTYLRPNPVDLLVPGLPHVVVR